MTINGLGLILALLPTYLVRFKIFGLPTTLLELFIVVFLILVLLKTSRTDFRSLKSLGGLNWAIGLFVLAGIISTIMSPVPIKAFGLLKAFIIEPVLLFYATRLVIKTENDIRIALKWLLGSASIISLFGLVQYFTFLFLPIRFWGTGEEMARIVAVFEHPNQLALYLAPLFIFFLTLWLANYPLLNNRKIWLTALLLMGTALILTFSRGAWLGVGVVGIILLSRMFTWKKIIWPILIITALFLLVPPLFERVQLSFSDPSSAAHLQLMKQGIIKIFESPFFGNGLSGFRTTLEQAGYPGEVLNNPHNIFLTFWTELGILGVLAFALIFYLASARYKKQPTTLKFAAGMFLLTVIVHGLVDAPYFKNDLSVLFWFILALF